MPLWPLSSAVYFCTGIFELQPKWIGLKNNRLGSKLAKVHILFTENGFYVSLLHWIFWKLCGLTTRYSKANEISPWLQCCMPHCFEHAIFTLDIKINDGNPTCITTLGWNRPKIGEISLIEFHKLHAQTPDSQTSPTLTVEITAQRVSINAGVGVPE